VQSDPAFDSAEASLAFAEGVRPDLVVGIGGGSRLDIAKLTAMTGMDALVHAIESYTGKRATPFTDALNLDAIRIIAANLRRAYENGTDRRARENMLYVSCMAGMAFSNTQNALDHALAPWPSGAGSTCPTAS
jgi:alcohol dehydrogenase class IV